MNIDLPDASVDFAIARLVFQHLSDPCGAAREILRTLKPGGKLVVIDSDDGLWGLSDPEIPEMGAALTTYGQAQAALGGNRRIGRSLLRILAGAGFVNLDLEALISHSDQLGLEALLPHLDPDRLLPLVAAGVLSEATLHCFQASHRNFLGAQDPLLMMVLVMACGQRPVATIRDDG
jgi:SAM-dependent methyltransferase